MKKTTVFVALLVLFLWFNFNQIFAQESKTPWHNIERSLRYQPDGNDFVITNGTRRFNRALYGSNTGFRVETGDLPEFALYMPVMGGNMKLGIISGSKSKWVIDCDNITARYSAGSMIYEITDSLLGSGKLHIKVLSMFDVEGIVVKAEFAGVEEDCKLLWVYGGASGKRFRREGDIGADPESVFYLKPEYCSSNNFKIDENAFILHYGKEKQLNGIIPPASELKIADANKQDSPLILLQSGQSGNPLLTGQIKAENDTEMYFTVYVPGKEQQVDYKDLSLLFLQAEETREKIADRVTLTTPDKFVNPIGNALSMAADAIWDDPCYQHGAVAWRRPLLGWRGAYTADRLGWRDRAKMHFEAYAKSQYTEPPTGVNTPNPKTNLSRQLEKAGVSIFHKGYISRYPGKQSKPHHYDMNLVYIDELLWHFNWIGDTAFIREMWPVIERHLEWEKRSFDPDDDGLYNAYCCIWASDALQYSGGGVTHSTSYNYRSNAMIAEIAEIMGENPEPYQKEAGKIKEAVNSELWLPEKGWYAENKDLLGLQRVHPIPAVWTIYHAIDSNLPDIFQAYQATRYVDTQIPHIPIIAKGLPENEYYTLATSNWMPYTWSINNVALAENLHTALAYWQAGRTEEAFRLWKSQFMESMYLGGSPANFQQLSFYDAFRGELYRDFADPVGVASRTLVEGLFGIVPDALNNTLFIRPGLPAEWESASLNIPDISFDYKRDENTETYVLISHFEKKMNLKFRCHAIRESVKSITINGNLAEWKSVDETVGNPVIEVSTPYYEKWEIKIEWEGNTPDNPETPDFAASGELFTVELNKGEVVEVYDPQQILTNIEKNNKAVKAVLTDNYGYKTFFIKVKQNQLQWWVPVDIEIRKPVDIIATSKQEAGNIKFRIQNNTNENITAEIIVHNTKKAFSKEITLSPNIISNEIEVPATFLVTGSNPVQIKFNNTIYEENVVNWNITKQNRSYEPVEMTKLFNESVDNIFRQEYLSPRSPYPTLQIPKQGIGDWCSYKELPEIDDSGLRKVAGKENKIELPQGVPFITPGGETENPNILYTSLWDNFPDSAVVKLSGKASHVYLLMAGSTHHMQSRFENGIVEVVYKDNTSETIELKNPETWWPIEQDYYDDGFAFSVDAPRPPRLYLKTGEVILDSYDVLAVNKTIKIEGGAASILDLPLDPGKKLKELKLKTTANDIVIGLMGVTLCRD